MTLRTSRFGVALYGEDRQIPDDFAGIESPKLKFNFTISFDYTNMLLGSPVGNEDPYKMDFGIKQLTRPNPNIIYEDVNYYNFMTKVAVRVDFGVMTVTFYDDKTNKAHDIFKNYMEAISPITNVSRSSAPLLHRNGQSTSSSLGPMQGGAENGPIKNIRVTHITNHLNKTVVYDFLNPKIQNVILDELDMTQSDVNTITFTFLYDTFNISYTTGRSTTKTYEDLTPELRAPSYTLEELPPPPNQAVSQSKIRQLARDGVPPLFLPPV